MIEKANKEIKELQAYTENLTKENEHRLKVLELSRLGLSQYDAEILVTSGERTKSSHEALLQAGKNMLAERAAKIAPDITWKFEESDDKMNRGKLKTVTIHSKNEVRFRPPYDGEQRLGLMLRSSPHLGNDVILSIPHGQFICRVGDRCGVIVKFGEKKAQRFVATEPSDGSANVLFLRDYAPFISNLKRSQKILIEAEFYQEGSRVFEFDASGLIW